MYNAYVDTVMTVNFRYTVPHQDFNLSFSILQIPEKSYDQDFAPGTDCLQPLEAWWAGLFANFWSSFSSEGSPYQSVDKNQFVRCTTESVRGSWWWLEDRLGQHPPDWFHWAALCRPAVSASAAQGHCVETDILPTQKVKKKTTTFE